MVKFDAMLKGKDDKHWIVCHPDDYPYDEYKGYKVERTKLIAKGNAILRWI